MEADEDCQPVEWWQHVGLFSRPASAPLAPPTVETSGVYALSLGEVCVFWPEGTVICIRAKGS